MRKECLENLTFMRQGSRGTASKLLRDWIAEQRQRGIIKGQRLLRAIKDRK